jgi:hypothetical protein
MGLGRKELLPTQKRRVQAVLTTPAPVIRQNAMETESSFFLAED